MVDALLLDFYGTVVHEDDVVIDQICGSICRSASVPATPKEVGRYWWATFSEIFTHSHGDAFQTQRRIESVSLAQTIERFGARCDVEELSEPLFAHWECPPIFDDAVELLDGVRVPVVVVSNIDRHDIEAAIDHHGLVFEHVVTSEDVRSYKPRPELFAAGLQLVDCRPDRVLHVGDSLTSDVAGALGLGIPVAWVNRSGRPSPKAPGPTHEVTRLTDLAGLLVS